MRNSPDLKFSSSRSARYVAEMAYNQWLVTLNKTRDRPLGTVQKERSALMVVHIRLEKMRNADPEHRKRLIAIHGMSIPELEDLRRHQAQRYLAAKKRGLDGYDREQRETMAEFARIEKQNQEARSPNPTNLAKLRASQKRNVR